MKRTIVTYGSPVLRETARRVDRITPDIRRLAADMIEAMHAADGVGLAAQQVGETWALCVVDVPARHDAETEGGPRQNAHVTMPLVLVNPELVGHSDEEISRSEGCLSFPDIQVPVARAAEVTVRFQDLDGQSQSLRVAGFVARAVQHEIDHLRGILLVDRMSAVKRISLAGQLRKLKRKTQEQAAGKD